MGTKQAVPNSIDLLAFFAERLKVYLREKGARHDLIDAIFALGAPIPLLDGEGRAAGAGWGDGSPHPASFAGDPPHKGEGLPTSSIAGANDDLLMIVKRVEALSAFLDTEDGKSLVAGYKRAANILRAEEKKDGAGAFSERHSPNLRSEPAEHQLAAAIDRARDEVTSRVAQEDFAGAMHALAKLRAPVDAFFTDVTVNADDSRTRKNRLQMLGELRETMHAVADFPRLRDSSLMVRAGHSLPSRTMRHGFILRDAILSVAPQDEANQSGV